MKPSLIAAGAATLLLVAYSLGMSATPARSQDILLAPIVGKSWPPNASDMVVVNGVLSRVPNVFAKVYTVPTNKWFVLTDFSFDPNEHHSLVQKLNQKEETKWNLEGTITSNRVFEVGSHRVGIPFFPGSEVGFKSPNPGSTKLRYHLRGYLTNR